MESGRQIIKLIDLLTKDTREVEVEFSPLGIAIYSAKKRIYNIELEDGRLRMNCGARSNKEPWYSCVHTD